MTRIIGKRLSCLMRAYLLGPAHPMKLRFWGWLRKIQRSARLTVPYASGAWITLDDGDYLQWQVLVSGLYEPEVYEALFQHVHSDEIVWDVGAHIGTFSVRALSDPRVKEVHSFEPDPKNASLLTINLGLNKGNYKIYPYALSQFSETRKLYRHSEQNTGLSSLMEVRPFGEPPETFSNEVFDVSCKTADQLVFQEGVPSPTLLKIDVEGWEREVLEGSKRLLCEKPPKAIAIETLCDSQGNITDQSLLFLLRDSGYQIERIHRPEGNIELVENYLAVYQDPNGKRV
jgi:FkbM family methyltransferase